MIIPYCSLNTFAAWEARPSGVPVPGVPHTPRSGQGSVPQHWQTGSLANTAAGRIAFPNYMWICTYRSVLSSILLGLEFLHQVLQLQRGDGRNHQSLGRKKKEEKSGKTHAHAKQAPRCVMGCPDPCSCPLPAALPVQAALPDLPPGAIG